MIEIDTDILKENGKNLENLAVDYFTINNKVFSRITNVPTVTGEWVGESAKRFASSAAVDKSQYVKFYGITHQYGTYLKNAAEIIENLCKRVKMK